MRIDSPAIYGTATISADLSVAGGIVNVALKTALDGYATTTSVSGLDTTVSEYYQQHSEAIQTILKDLDGYVADGYAVIGSITSDGYGELLVHGQIYSDQQGTTTPTGVDATVDFAYGNTATIDLGLSDGNMTVTLVNGKNGGRYVILFIQGPVARTVTFSPSVKTEGGSGIPNLSTANNAEDIINLLYLNGVYYATAAFAWSN